MRGVRRVTAAAKPHDPMGDRNPASAGERWLPSLTEMLQLMREDKADLLELIYDRALKERNYRAADTAFELLDMIRGPRLRWNGDGWTVAQTTG